MEYIDSVLTSSFNRSRLLPANRNQSSSLRTTKKFIGVLLAAAALNTPVLAGPVPEQAEKKLDERAPSQLSLFCAPRSNTATSPVKNFRVDVAVAQAQARKAALTTGKSGDPHRYFSGDHLVFDVHNCDKAGAILWEYPIYWVGKKTGTDDYRDHRHISLSLASAL
ncbi:hypothetical protein VN97_g2165 [Penicillium thymicola]|uniref:Uncharacterized protein n=1 Tax=Penicillium thymicola TaxID=293382 RepID=A0AAI9XBQ2_PENTH|nr:hypothetical protein VN97_g2165 [Penicillium thymicola]